MAKLILHNRTYLFHVFQTFQPDNTSSFCFSCLESSFSFIYLFKFFQCVNVWARLLDYQPLFVKWACTPACVDRKVACVASVSVWFRSKVRPTNDKERDFRFWQHEKWNESSPPPSSFTRPIFRAVFDSRNLFFAPKPHGNACYASKPQGTKPHALERWRKIEPSDLITTNY